ncbi:MAG TPA: hypothetical protein VGO62_14425, partial [Myxococcota bacterium]
QAVLQAPDYLQWAARFDIVGERPNFGATYAVREAVALSFSVLPFPFLRVRAELFLPLDAEYNFAPPQVLGMVAWSF